MRNKMQGKKWLSILLVVMMLVSLMPAAAFAEGEVAGDGVEASEGTDSAETIIPENETTNPDTTIKESTTQTDLDETLMQN